LLINGEGKDIQGDTVMDDTTGFASVVAASPAVDPVINAISTALSGMSTEDRATNETTTDAAEDRQGDLMVIVDKKAGRKAEKGKTRRLEMEARRVVRLPIGLKRPRKA
jgi:hypothetical protein